uniref:Guanine nucleotide exchange factor for Rab-3A n=1 Tax=Lygus hesperus TaxID=30085 RepID=A0A0A9YQ53_LYGHE
MKDMQDNQDGEQPLTPTHNVFVIESGNFTSPKKSPVQTNPFLSGDETLVVANNIVNGAKYETLNGSPKRPVDTRVDLLTSPLTAGLSNEPPPQDLLQMSRGEVECDDGEVNRDLDLDATRDSGLESAASSWDRTIAEVREHAFTRLQDELRKAHDELKLRDEEVSRLTRIRSEVESELEELTASLFQEAHNMVREANVKQAGAEKSLKESLMQVEVLTAEVAALKALVLTSTPSRPNPHLHPQLKEDASGGLFKKHRRSPSHNNLKYGRDGSPPYSPVKENITASMDMTDARDSALEVDPILHKEFLAWKQAPTTDKTDPFIARIYKEDIEYCLDFSNAELSQQVRDAMATGEVFIEAVSDKTKNNFPKKCALLDAVRHCHYRLRVGESSSWYPISHMCRNRIIAVCDFLNYLKYIQRGLVKSSVQTSTGKS